MKLINIPDSQKIFSLVVGFTFMWIYKSQITGAIFSGKGFYGRNLLYQLFFVVFVTFLFACVLFLLIKLFQLLPFFARFLRNSETKYQELLENLRCDRTYRIIFSLGMIAAGVATIYLVNNLLVNIDTENWLYTAHNGLPGLTPIGWDFRNGIYRPAHKLFIGKTFQQIWQNRVNTNTYPPFVLLVGLVFQLFDENTGYLIQVALLVLANIVSLGLAAGMIRDFVLERLNLSKNMVKLITASLFFLSLTLMLFSYPFAFSLERGNYDIYAIFFSLLALRVLLHHPEKLWTQVILLTIATHLKVYPAILFILLLRQHGKKMILPTLAANLVFLLILGPNNAIAFFASMLQSYGVGNKWPDFDNHSSYSFIRLIVDNYLPKLKPEFILLWLVFTIIPVLIWGLIVIKTWTKKNSPTLLFSLFMVSVSVMDLIPTVSHDYKQTILFPVIVLLMALILREIVTKGRFLDYLQLALLLVVSLLLCRSYLYFGELNYYYLANKYLWSLALECLAAWNCFRMVNNSTQSLPDKTAIPGEDIENI